MDKFADLDASLACLIRSRSNAFSRIALQFEKADIAARHRSQSGQDSLLL